MFRSFIDFIIAYPHEKGIHFNISITVCDHDNNADGPECTEWTQAVAPADTHNWDTGIGSTPTDHTGPLNDHTFHTSTGKQDDINTMRKFTSFLYIFHYFYTKHIILNACQSASHIYCRIVAY